MNAAQTSDRSVMGNCITVGALMGLLVGAVFILFEMAAAMMINQSSDAAGLEDAEERQEAG